jgi:aspartate aminotransferase
MGDLIRLSVGEPDFPTPEHICEAARHAITEGWTCYTPQRGFGELREAVAETFRTENSIDVSAEQVVVSCGGKYSLYNAIQCAVRPGDEVIVPHPHWFATLEQVRRVGGLPVPSATGQGLRPESA